MSTVCAPGLLITDPKPQHAIVFGQDLRTEITAQARWPLRNGQQRTAPLQVGAQRHAGERVRIWIDRHGNPTDPPPTPGVMIARAAGTGFELMLGGWVLLGALWWAVCGLLGRINAAWWEMQWARRGQGGVAAPGSRKRAK